jgi:hypothetical protein
MKKRVILLLFLFVATVFAGGAYINYKSASSDGSGSVTLTWSTNEEANVKEFLITRNSPPSNDYIEIARVTAKGSNSNYTYTDAAAYKEASDLIFKYRILIIDNAGQEEGSFDISVSQNLSGYKRTWGSIKAMFR